MTAQRRQGGGRGSVARSLRVAPIASVVLAAGLLSGPGSHADEGQPTAQIAYDCAVPDPPPTTSDPSGGATDSAGGSTPSAGDSTVRASVRIGTQLPLTAAPGRPIRPGTVTVEAALPFDGLAGLLPPGANGLASDGALGVRIQQGKASADATWSGLTADAAVPPSDGAVHLAATGEAPTITVSDAGDVDLHAGSLALKLTPSTDGVPATASSFTLTCAPADKDPATTRLAHISVPDGSTGTGEPSASGAPDSRGTRRDGIAVAPQEDGPTGASTCGPAPTGVPDLSQIPDPLPGTVLGPLKPQPGIRACAYAVGLSTIKKLDGSMVINDPAKEPGLMNVRASMQTQGSIAPGPFYSRIDNLGELALPDAESTFLGFGFTPVTAKASFENEQITISTGTIGSSPNAKPFAVATFLQSLRLHDVEVNGTPLDVGPDCRTTKPYRVTLRGDFTSTTGRYINVLSGGILKGMVDIPAFSGCGTHGEDLDPLFTASISGPDNYIVMNQAVTCLPDFPGTPQCPPVIPPLPGDEAR
ncbi:hypothetical protein GTW43_34560 [Streptomyces sp. SID5785]|uniref:DUF6801 domain-containing protein n=1 Tax=Streptomyces sp. SID5785 TaxID=2690309 RepID=UPI001360F810|nr:DUF6801 domain-containing protein [Streptomyces sp. SID5785]MZD10164.1 hypothetical protein [Streptomyces sp. SID5785]